MKTLKQLWQENGEKPFWASCPYKASIVYMVGFSKAGAPIIERGDGKLLYETGDKGWYLAEDPTKHKPKMRVWRLSSGEIVLAETGVERGHREDITAELAGILKAEGGDLL